MMNFVGIRVRLRDGSTGTITGGELNVDMDGYLEYGVPVGELELVDTNDVDVEPVHMIFKGGKDGRLLP